MFKAGTIENSEFLFATYIAGLIFALLIGTFLPTQAGINLLLAAAVSVVIGNLALSLYVLILKIPVNSIQNILHAPWYLWTGGLLSMTYLAATIILAPLLSAATMVGLIVAEQMLTSIAPGSFWVS